MLLANLPLALAFDDEEGLVLDFVDVQTVEKPDGRVQSNMQVCFVSLLVTRTISGWPANFSVLASPGITTTGAF